MVRRSFGFTYLVNKQQLVRLLMNIATVEIVALAEGSRLSILAVYLVGYFFKRLSFSDVCGELTGPTDPMALSPFAITSLGVCYNLNALSVQVKKSRLTFLPRLWFASAMICKVVLWWPLS